MGLPLSAVLAVIIVTVTRLTLGQEEFNLGDAEQNSTIDSLDSFTNPGEEERHLGFLGQNRGCSPGKRPDPKNCNRYFWCVEDPPSVFREYHLYCPLSLVYNPQDSQCVSRNSYQCGVLSPLIPPRWPFIIPTTVPTTTKPSSSTGNPNFSCISTMSYQFSSNIGGVAPATVDCPPGFFCNEKCRIPCVDNVASC